MPYGRSRCCRSLRGWAAWLLCNGLGPRPPGRDGGSSSLSMSASAKCARPPAVGHRDRRSPSQGCCTRSTCPCCRPFGPKGATRHPCHVIIVIVPCVFRDQVAFLRRAMCLSSSCLTNIGLGYAVYSSNCAAPEPFPFSPSPITRLPRLWTPPRAARLPVRRNRLGARRAAAAVLAASSVLPEECVAEGQSPSWSLLAKTNAAVLRSQELRQGGGRGGRYRGGEEEGGALAVG